LIGSSGDDHGEEGVSLECHWVGCFDDGLELEHLGVHVERGDCSGCDDDGGESFEDGCNGHGWVKAADFVSETSKRLIALTSSGR
jgi:hypothetical protein